MINPLPTHAHANTRFLFYHEWCSVADVGRLKRITKPVQQTRLLHSAETSAFQPGYSDETININD